MVYIMVGLHDIVRGIHKGATCMTSNVLSIFFNEITSLGLPAYAVNLEEDDAGILEVYAIETENGYIYWHCLNTEKIIEYPAYDDDRITLLLSIHILPSRYGLNDVLQERDIFIAYQNRDYIDEIHKDVLTENIIQEMINVLPELRHNPAYTVYEGLSKKMEEINAAYNEAFDTIVIDYPEQEIASFPLQTEQAKLYLADNNAEVSFLRLLYAGRVSRGYKETLIELCYKILGKASVFEPISGYLSGIRQAMEKELEAIVAKVEADEITHYTGYKLCMHVHVEYPIPTREQFEQMANPAV